MTVFGGEADLTQFVIPYQILFPIGKTLHKIIAEAEQEGEGEGWVTAQSSKRPVAKFAKVTAATLKKFKKK